jgi:hypothetical protein
MSRRPISQAQALAGLMLVVVLLSVAKRVWPELVPVSALTVPAMVGGWRLSQRAMVPLAVVILLAVVVDVAATPDGRSAVAGGVVALVVLLALWYAGERESWGLDPWQGMPILLSVRDRVRAQGEPPQLRPGWVLARALRSAGDAAFRGDFTLAHQRGDVVEAMVVDVSGHGLSVASRAMQLAGAFGGLIREVPAEATLAACNDYSVGQQSDRHYSTAVLVVVDQVTGRGWVSRAGHPPAGLRRADGSWEELSPRGPVLGLSADADFAATEFVLGRGDTVVLVSDGALDDAAADPWTGVRRAVTSWIDEGIQTGTTELPDIHGDSDDDQTILVLHRGAAVSSDPLG